MVRGANRPIDPADELQMGGTDRVGSSGGPEQRQLELTT
jgi:hypothetical protein